MRGFLSRNFKYFSAAGVIAGVMGTATPNEAPVSAMVVPDAKVDFTQSSFLKYGEAARTNNALQVLCARLPDACHREVPTKTVELTDKLFQKIERINLEANRDIIPREDRDKFGVEDFWAFAEDGEGDCEDYVYFKRKRLHEELGIPMESMSTVVVLDETQSGHAILAIQTDKGHLLLDNKFNKVTFPMESPHTFVKATSFSTHENMQYVELQAPFMSIAQAPVSGLGTFLGSKAVAAATLDGSLIKSMRKKERKWDHPLPPRRPNGL